MLRTCTQWGLARAPTAYFFFAPVSLELGIAIEFEVKINLRLFRSLPIAVQNGFSIEITEYQIRKPSALAAQQKTTHSLVFLKQGQRTVFKAGDQHLPAPI